MDLLPLLPSCFRLNSQMEIQIKQQEIEREEMPERLNENTICKWSEHFKMLKTQDGGNARLSKAKSFLKHHCIKWSKEHKNWVCYPIRSYNKSFYHIRWDKELPNFKTGEKGEFSCSCQFNQKVGQMCSHILSLYLFLKLYNYNKKHSQMELFPREIVEDGE